MGLTIVLVMLLFMAILVISLIADPFNTIIERGVDNSGMSGFEAMFFNNWFLVLLFGATLAFFGIIIGGKS